MRCSRSCPGTDASSFRPTARSKAVRRCARRSRQRASRSGASRTPKSWPAPPAIRLGRAGAGQRCVRLRRARRRAWGVCHGPRFSGPKKTALRIPVRRRLPVLSVDAAVEFGDGDQIRIPGAPRGRLPGPGSRATPRPSSILQPRASSMIPLSSTATRSASEGALPRAGGLSGPNSFAGRT